MISLGIQYLVMGNLSPILQYSIIAVPVVLATIIFATTTVALALVIAAIDPPSSPHFAVNPTLLLKDPSQPADCSTNKDKASSAQQTVAASLDWSTPRPYHAKIWARARSTAIQIMCGPNSGLFGRHTTRLSIRRGRSPVLWILSLLFLIALVSAKETTFESSAPGGGSPEVKAYDPLVPLNDQLQIPVAAGVPPPTAHKDTVQKEQAYIERLEADRVDRQGSLYVELTPQDLLRMEEANLGSSNVVRYSKEPLPWEVLGEEEDDVYGDLEWSHSPWGGKFRYENDQDDSYADTSRDHDRPFESTVIADKDRHSQSQYRSQRAHREQEGFSAFRVDMNDGSDISDDLGLSRTESADSAGRQEDVETMNEGSPDSNAKDFDMMQVDSHVDQETDKGHPQMDEVDLLGYEAEVDWLNEQDEIKHAQRKQQHHHHHSGRFEGEIPNAEFGAEDDDEEDTEGQGDEEGDIESGESEETDDEALEDEAVEGAEGAEEEEYTPGMSPEEVYNDPDWHAKHGGLNPKHFHLSNHKAAIHKNGVTRAEKNDRDQDGIVFPELHSNQPYSKLVYPITRNDPDSSLGYVAYNRQGDRIIDFSMVGWNEGNTDLPDPTKDVPVMERLSPRAEADSDMDKGDDTERIQNALDRVSKTTKTMVRRNDVVPKGALVLERGVYRISKPLKIYSSGILFRGDPKGGSRIVFQWEPTGPRYAIEVEGDTDEMLEDTRVPIISDYTPVGSPWLALDPTYIQEAGLALGDQIVVTRIGNERWVKDIGMDDFNSDKKGVKPWKKMTGRMYRNIRSLNLQTGVIQLDAPIPVSISRRYGGGFVTKYRDGKIRAIGIQFLDMVFPNNIGRTKNDMLDEEGRGSKDYRFSYEIFANYALRVDCACHMYISHITSAFFHNFVSLGSDVHHITMDSVVHSYPDEMLSGQSAFQLSGQLVLIKNSLSQGSFHFFVDINHVMGPNVFHRSMGTNVGKTQQPIPLDFAPGEVGPHMKFCTGILVDQVVTDGSIQIVNRGDMGTGQGYSGANSVVWNSRAREGILTHRAKGFQNFVIGSETLEAEDRQPWDSHGWKEHLGSEVLPGSLYLRQLSDRLNRLAKGWVA